MTGGPAFFANLSRSFGFWKTKYADIALTNDGKTATVFSNSGGSAICDIFHSTGKHYFELLMEGPSGAYIPGAAFAPSVGIINQGNLSRVPGVETTSWGIESSGRRIHNSVFEYWGPGGYGPDDVLMFAVDSDAKKVWYGKNGAWPADPVSGLGQMAIMTGTEFAPAFGSAYKDAKATIITNNSEFHYAKPTGYLAWYV